MTTALAPTTAAQHANAAVIGRLEAEIEQLTGAAPRQLQTASAGAVATRQRDLARAHQLMQEKSWNRALRQLAQAWPLLDFEHLDETQRAWLAANLEIAQEAQGAAGAIAEKYVNQARILGVGEALPAGLTLDALEGTPARLLLQQMEINGPIFIKSMMGLGRSRAEIERSAFSITMGDLMKSILDVPRNAVIEASWKDDASSGVAWVTDGNPCDWCRKLAGWEAKAVEPGTGTGGHAHCGCVYQPVYAA